MRIIFVCIIYIYIYIYLYLFILCFFFSFFFFSFLMLMLSFKNCFMLDEALCCILCMKSAIQINYLQYVRRDVFFYLFFLFFLSPLKRRKKHLFIIIYFNSWSIFFHVLLQPQIRKSGTVWKTQIKKESSDF